MLVNHFETLVAQHMGLPSQICIYNEFCGKGIREKPLAEMVFSPAQFKFGYAKSETLRRHCRECSYLKDCWGECPKNCLIRTPDGEVGLNYLCAGLKKFNKHALPEAEQIADEIRQQQNSRIPKAHDSWRGSSNAFIDHNGMPARRRK